MIQEIGSGLLLHTDSFGMEDPLGGGVQVTSKKGYLVENGELTTLTKGITLSGPVLDLLHQINAVSKGPVEFDGGVCGKGVEDVVPVSSGGVYIRVKRAIVSPG